VVLFLRRIFGLLKNECKCAYAETTVAVETEKQSFYLHFNINLMQFVRKKAIFVAISMIINTQNRLLEYKL